MAEEVHENAEPIPGIDRPKKWWWTELWFENRPLFKEIVKHVLIFIIFVMLLEGYHRIHKSSQLPPEELAWLNSIHFWGYIVLLIVLGLCLFIKVLIIELRGIRREE